MCRDDLAQHGESEAVNHVISELSLRLFPQGEVGRIEEAAEKLIAAMFGN
jgi:hypothetical protein